MLNQIRFETCVLDLEIVDRDRAFGFYDELKKHHIPVEVTIEIDGIPFGRQGAVDLLSLLGCTELRGEHLDWRIFNCGCGFQECAGLDHPLAMYYRGPEMQWTFGWEFAYWAAYPYCNRRDPINLRFDTDCMRREAKKVRSEIRRIGNGDLDRIRVPIYNQPLGIVLGDAEL